MSAEYPVVDVDPKWKAEPEQMGSKDKFWFRNPASDRDWLFKFPTENTGGHWAKKSPTKSLARWVSSRPGLS